MFYKYRHNPLQDPLAALQSIIVRIKKDKSKLSWRENYQKYLDYAAKGEARYSDGNLRAVVKILAEIASSDDAILLIEQIIQEYEHNSSKLDIILSDALEKLHSYFLEYDTKGKEIRQRFIDIQNQFDLELSSLRFHDADYRDQFLELDAQFIYYYKYSPLLFLPETLRILLAAVRAPDSYIFDDNYVSDDPEDRDRLKNLRFESWAESISEKELANILDDINSIITGRKPYREFTHAGELESSSIVWNSHLGVWHMYQNRHQLGLVAKYVVKKPYNQLLVPQVIVVPYPAAIVRLLLTSLYPHPAHGATFEGRFISKKGIKEGRPLISDREAKQILTEIVVRWAQTQVKPEIVVDESSPLVKWNLPWGKLKKAKASHDEEAFQNILERFLPIESGFLGRLIVWFNYRSNPYPTPLTGPQITPYTFRQLEEPIPTGPIHPLYHATVSISGILEDGFKPRALLGDREALGGGSRWVISMTQTLETACIIAYHLEKFVSISKGLISLQDIVDMINDRGILRKVLEFWLSSGQINHYKRDNPAYYLDALLKGFVPTMVDGLCMKISELPEDAFIHKDLTTWLGGDGEERFYGIYFVKAPVEKIRQQILTFYNCYIWVLGDTSRVDEDIAVENPVFWGLDVSNFIDVNLDDIGVIEAYLPKGLFYPKRVENKLNEARKSNNIPDGAFVYLPSMDEYRVYDFEALKVSRVISCEEINEKLFGL
jgi:hypothetical protein